MSDGDARRPCLPAVGRVWCLAVNRQPGSPYQEWTYGASLSTGSLAHRAKNELAGSALEAAICLNGMPVASAKVPVPKPVAIMVMLTCSRNRKGNVIAVYRAAKKVLVGRPTPA